MGAMFKWHTSDRSHTEMALRRQHAREARLHARTVLSNPSLVDAGSGIEGGSDDPFGDLGGSWGFVSTGGPRVPYALLNRSSHGHCANQHWPGWLQGRLRPYPSCLVSELPRPQI